MNDNDANQDTKNDIEYHKDQIAWHEKMIALERGTVERLEALLKELESSAIISK